MVLPIPLAPFQELDIQGESITIDVNAKQIVIPTDNQYLLPSFNQWTLNPNRCNLEETPCGGLKNSIMQDTFPGSISIEGNCCYLQNLAGTCTGKTIGAGILSETASILNTGSTGIEFAMADGVIFRPQNGIPFLLRPPSAIVEEFKIVNTSNEVQKYTLSIVCPDSISKIELYNISKGIREPITLTKISNNEYSFSELKSTAYNSSELFLITIIYATLNYTQSFPDNGNQIIGLQNMSKSFIAFYDPDKPEINFIYFTERPKSLSYKQNSNGIITEIVIDPVNGQLYCGKVHHSNTSRVTRSGEIPDCLNAEIEGSVTKFLQSFGMKTDFPPHATLTTWIVQAISDTKILPNSPISNDDIGSSISIRMCSGEYTCASFVVQSDEDVVLTFEASDLVCGSNTISASAIDIKYVKCWYQSNYDSGYMLHYAPIGRYLTPELLINDDSLIKAVSDYAVWDDTNPFGKNYLKLTTGEYVDISTTSINPVASHISDSEKLMPLYLQKNYKKQIWLTLHPLSGTVNGNYSGYIYIKSKGVVITTISLSLTVLPFLLLPSSIEHSVYYRGVLTSAENLISAISKSQSQYTADLKNLLAHGITVPHIQNQLSWSNVETILLLTESLGFDTSHIYYRGLNLASSNEDIIYVNNMAKSHGIKTVYVYGMDETYLNTTDYRDKINFIHSLGMKIFCAQFVSQAIDIADVLDLAVLSVYLDKSISALYHSYTSSDGELHKIYSYNNPQTGPEFPRVYRLNYGLQLWQNDYDGAMPFAYQYEADTPANDMWNDFDGILYKKLAFAYPTLNNPINTVQFEGYREADNDTKYLATLQAAISAHPGHIATIADNWLTTLKSSDLSTQNLDAIREQMIDYILQLII